MSKTVYFQPPAKPVPQANSIPSKYKKQMFMTYGTVTENNEDGTCNIELVNGFLAEHVRIPSTTWAVLSPVQGGISYPPENSKVVIFYPEGDINSGLVYPAYLNDKNEDVTNELLGQGDKTIFPAGWTYTFNQETGEITLTNGETFNLTLNPETPSISLTDFNGNTIASTGSSSLMINGNLEVLQ